MFNRYKRSLAILFVMAIMFTGCEDYLGDDINQDPNNPTSVPVFVMLPAIEVFLTDVDGGDFSRHSSLIVQQAEGVARQWSSFDNYSSLIPATFNTAWNNMYENILIEVVTMISVAEEAGFNHYVGAGNILLAYALMMSTDVWDDIPYTEALLGVENSNPAFDTQASIYTEVYSLLESGRTLLAGENGGLDLQNDVIYGGDTDLWIQLSYAIEARGRLHEGNYAAALTAEGNAFQSAADNMSYQYPDQASPQGWFRFNRDREGDIEFHPTMGAIMTDLNDTSRLAMFNPVFNAGDHPYFVADFDWELISYREMKFLQAEALLETGAAAADIRDAYLAGINASFDHLGLDATDYLTNTDVDPGVGNITLEHIITQKYIGLFTHTEVFSDWRRTGIPSLSPVSGSAVPVRFPYGSDEHLFNSNAPTEQSINIFTNRVGWNR